MGKTIEHCLRETLQLVALEDAPAQSFLMDIGGHHLEWQVAVDMLYRCAVSELIRIIPYADRAESLSLREYVGIMARSDPSSVGTDDWDSAKFWVGTYVIGTMKCAKLLAKNGLLDVKSTLILASGYEQEATIGAYPDMNFESSSEAMSRSLELRELAKISELACPVDDFERSKNEMAFIEDVKLVFSSAGVDWSEGAIFPVGEGL